MDQITCDSHNKPVVLGGDLTIRHQDGVFCRSTEFRIGVLAREQVMALLITGQGLKWLAEFPRPQGKADKG